MLAFSVVAAHSGAPRYLAGMAAAAVPAFFVISGFYMSLVLTTKYRSPRAVTTFYTSRFLRLFPMYWAVLALAIGLGTLPSSGVVALDRVWTMPQNVSRLLLDGSAVSLVAWVPNLLIVGSDVLRVLAVDAHAGIVAFPAGRETSTVRGLYQYLYLPQIWSVGNEIIFYAAAPFLVRVSTAKLALFAGAALCMRWAPPSLVWYHLLPTANVVFFVLGMIGYRALPAVQRLPVALLKSVAMVPFAVWLVWPLMGHARWLVVPAWIIYGAGVPALFHLSQRWKRGAALGELSYPVYLCHMLFVYPAAIFGPFACVAVFAASCALSAVLVRFIDRPVETLRHRVAFRRVAPALP
jgi:peptidoglycan/LPS O-acetylase OafA/YrhL